MKSRTSDFNPPANKLETDPRWQLIQRIVVSPGFVNSQRLSAFLLFVCEKALMGAADSLNERGVGVAVFQRNPDYDPRDDNIVRSHASRLRIRLEEYFEEEGSGETLRVHIRRGSYVPFFEEVAEVEDEVGADSSRLEPAGAANLPGQTAVPPRRWIRSWFLVLPPLVLIAVLTVATVVRYRDSRLLTPTHKLWAQLFREDQQTLIVPADSSLVITRLMVGHQIPLADYADGGYRESNKCDKPCDIRMVETVERLRYTSISDLEFAVKVTHLPETIMSRTVVRYARDLNMNDLKQSNLILAGSQEADPWISVISGQMTLVIHDDPSQGPLRVENRRPRRGEPSAYPYDSHDPEHQVLSTVAFLPNLSGNGSLLIVQGFNLAGTQAAADFVTSGKDLDELLHAYAGPKKSLPHFEILLSSTEINGMASHTVPLAVHILP